MNINVDFSVSEAALSELKKIVGEAQSMIRISAQSSGCSGTVYGLGLMEKEDVGSSDVTEEVGGLSFVSDKASAMLLDGVTLDWHSSDSSQGFKFSGSKSSGCCRKGGCS